MMKSIYRFLYRLEKFLFVKVLGYNKMEAKLAHPEEPYHNIAWYKFTPVRPEDFGVYAKLKGVHRSWFYTKSL